jgi:hypothetical protein
MKNIRGFGIIPFAVLMLICGAFATGAVKVEKYKVITNKEVLKNGKAEYKVNP